MGQIISLPYKICKTTCQYYYGLYYYIFGNGRTQPYNTNYSPLVSFGGNNCGSLTKNSTSSKVTSKEEEEDKQNKEQKQQEQQHELNIQHSRIHLYSLASNFYLYNKQHYRKGKYYEDLQDNLCNVTIPGTGIPLSYFVSNRISLLFFLITIYPSLSFVSSLHLWFVSYGAESISTEYSTRLLHPNDWFHYWRLNCSIVALHSLLNDMPIDYTMENKWTFLKNGDIHNIPISPFIKDSEAYVIKHKNEEGGLGIYFYTNAVYNGDWIIQKKISNSHWVQSLLPTNAPLSTFRIITSSRYCITTSNNKDITSDTCTDSNNNENNKIQAISCVFRAGRAGAATDHDCILFDVDINTGTIQGGTTNAHWYRIGLFKGLVTGPWRSYDEQRCINHPDITTSSSSTDNTNSSISGQIIPNFMDMINVCVNSHKTLCPTVPLCGWDVVLSDDIPNRPICLLEVNLSCNFFRGTFNEKNYFNFVDDAFTKFQNLRLHADVTKKSFA